MELVVHDESIDCLPARWLQAESVSLWIRQAIHKNEALDVNMVRSVMEAIYKSQKFEYRLKEAIEWGGNFEFPLNICERDSARLSESPSISHMVANLRLSRSRNRFNTSRVSCCVPQDYEEYAVLIDLSDGIRVFRSNTFVPNSATGLPPLRRAYQEAHSAVNKLLYDLWQDELLFLLPKEQLLLSQGVHFSCQHWSPKSMKKCGRPIHDASDSKHGAINCKEVSLMSEQHYGPVSLPTVVELANLILQFEESHIHVAGTTLTLDDVVLFKNDLSRAFMLLDFRSEDVELLAAELTNDICVVYHTGLFGLGTLPYAFAAISRVLERHLNVAPLKLGFAQMFGSLRVYVDDLMAVTIKQCLERDNKIVNDYCNALLGPGAVEPRKFESGRRLDLIGWLFDLDARVVTISQKNFHKVSFAFFDANIEKKVQVRTLEKLASLGSRYSLIIREMRVINAALYRNYAGMNNHNAYIRWHDDAVVAVLIWRAVLLHLRLNESTFAKPLDSFRSLDPTVVLCFDSSLTGVGVIIRRYMGVDDATNMLASSEVLAVGSFRYGQLLEPIEFNDESSYQNLSEFIGVIFGLLMLRSLGIMHTGVLLKGDSVTAMRWSETERFRGLLSRPAALTYLNVCIEFGYEIVGSEYVTSENNHECDRLSRGVSPQVLCQEGLCLPGLIYTMEESVGHLLSLCNFSHSFNTTADLLSFWGRVKEYLNQLDSSSCGGR